MKIRNIFDRGPRVRVSFPADEGRTRQEMTKECDINRIMARFDKTGAMEHVNKHAASYGDFDALDFHSALNLLKRTEQMFAELPADLRRDFGEDPAAFLSYVQDPANLEVLEKRGLLREGNSVQLAREASEAAAEAVLAVSTVAPTAPVAPAEVGAATIPT